MYSNSVRSFSTLRVKYFVKLATYGFITHLLKPASKRSSVASTYHKFCKLSNGDKLELRTFTPFAFRVTRYPTF